MSELDTHQLAIQIAGVGPKTDLPDNPDDDAVGYLWTANNRIKGDQSPPSSLNENTTVGLYTFKAPDMSGGAFANLRSNELIADQMGGVGDSINVFKSEISHSAFDFTIKGNEFNVDLLRSSERNPSYEIVGNTARGNQKIETTATSGQLEGKIGFVRDETIYFEEHNPDGDNAQEYLVTRGFYLSPQQRFEDGTKIFTSVPYWNKRKVRLYTYTYTEDANGNIPLTRRYVGSIDGTIQHDHNQIIVPSTSVGAQLRNVEVNRAAFNDTFVEGNWEAIKARASGPSDDTYYNISGRAIFKPEDRYKSKIVKETEYTDGTDLRSWFQFQGEDGDVLLAYDGRVKGEVGGNIDIGFGGSQPNFDVLPFELEPNEDTPEDIDNVWEPFVVNRLYDNETGTTYSATRDITQFADHDNKYIYHPVSIVACILMSTYNDQVDAENFDVLQGNWGMGAHVLLVEGFPDDVRTLIEDHPGDRVDQFVLGLNGQTEKIWDKLSSLLVQYGYYWSYTTNGQLTIKKLSNSDIEFWSEAQDNVISPEQSDTLSVDDGQDGIVDVVEGKVGRVGDYIRPKPIQIQFRRNNPNLTQKLARSAEFELEMSSYSRSSDARAEDRLKLLAGLLNFKKPKLRILVDDHLNLDASFSADYSLGAPVSLNQLPIAKKWINRDGTQQRIDKADVKFSGRIIERTYLPKKRAYNLTIEIIGLGLARWRAPSGVVKSVDADNNKITLEDSDNGGDEVLHGGEYFTVGDEIQIWTEDGQQVDSNIQEITAISGDTITLDGFAFGTNPSPDDIVELAYIDTDNSGTGYRNTSVIDNIDRAYVALAETDSTVGDAEDDADIYGAR